MEERGGSTIAIVSVGVLFFWVSLSLVCVFPIFFLCHSHLILVSIIFLFYLFSTSYLPSSLSLSLSSELHNIS